jgi:Tfp pilus assembly protein PilE
MLRKSILALTCLACLTACGCQNYSSGLVQTAARSDEAVVLSNLKAIMTAQQTYSVSNGSYGNFNQLTDGGFIDARFKGEKPVLNEYAYTITVVEKTPENPTPSYSVNADPARTGDRAGRHYFIDSNSTDIHVNNTQSATAADETIKP